MLKQLPLSILLTVTAIAGITPVKAHENIEVLSCQVSGDNVLSNLFENDPIRTSDLFVDDLLFPFTTPRTAAIALNEDILNSVGQVVLEARTYLRIQLEFLRRSGQGSQDKLKVKLVSISHDREQDEIPNAVIIAPDTEDSLSTNLLVRSRLDVHRRMKVSIRCTPGQADYLLLPTHKIKEEHDYVAQSLATTLPLLLMDSGDFDYRDNYFAHYIAKGFCLMGSGQALIRDMESFHAKIRDFWPTYEYGQKSLVPSFRSTPQGGITLNAAIQSYYCTHTVKQHCNDPEGPSDNICDVCDEFGIRTNQVTETIQPCDSPG